MAQTAVEPQYKKLALLVSVRGAGWYAAIFREKVAVK